MHVCVSVPQISVHVSVCAVETNDPHRIGVHICRRAHVHPPLSAPAPAVPGIQIGNLHDLANQPASQPWHTCPLVLHVRADFCRLRLAVLFVQHQLHDAKQQPHV